MKFQRALVKIEKSKTYQILVMTERQIKLSYAACGNEDGLTTLGKFIRLVRCATVHSSECECACHI